MSSNSGNSTSPVGPCVVPPTSSPAFTSTKDLLKIICKSHLYNPDTLKKRLEELIVNANENWTYAIFWESSIVDDTDSFTLKWGFGYYQEVIDKPNRISWATSVEVSDIGLFTFYLIRKSLDNNNGLPVQVMLSNQPVWLAGREQLSASHCEWAQKGQGLGLQTMVCIPSRDGVVELGSSELIFQSSNLIKQVRALFDFNNNQPDLLPFIPDLSGSDCLEATCKKLQSHRSQEVVEKQFGKTMKEAKTTEISLSLEVISKQFGKPIKEAAKCKTTEISLPLEVVEEQFGKTMKEAAKSLDVSESTLKRKLRKLGIPEWRGPNFVKRKANDSSIIQISTTKKNNGAIQDPSIVNINNNLITIKAEYANDMIKFCLPNSQSTFMIVQQEIGKKFKLIIGTYNLKYLDEDGDWICLTSDEEMIECIKSSTKLDRIVVRLCVVPSP
ncbi:putative transcription factor Nin-like family [Helianthus debilis subsp. tardiflorus]